MKKVVFIIVSVCLSICLSISVFAIDSSFTQLDLLPVDEWFLYQDGTTLIFDSATGSPNPNVGSQLANSNNGYDVSCIVYRYLSQNHTYNLGVYSTGDDLYTARGMSLYVFCLDVYMSVPTSGGLTSTPVPISGQVGCRFLDQNGDPLSNMIYNSGESADHFTKYFTFVLRETYDMEIYGFEISFVNSNNSSTDFITGTYSSFVFKNFGWKYDTGVDEVQEAILNGVDVLVYGTPTLQRLQALGFESFDDFVSYEDIFWGYVHNNFDDDYFDLIPAAGSENGFAFWRVLSAQYINSDFSPRLYSLIRIAVSVGLVGSIFGLVAGVVSKFKGGGRSD